MIKRISVGLLLLLMLALAGCGPDGPSSSGSTGGGRASTGGGEGGEGSGNWNLGDTSVATLELGKTQDELKASEVGAEFAPAKPAPEGLKDPVLAVSRNGRVVLYIEMKNGKAARFMTEDEGMQTSYGAHVGQAVEELEQLYGQGKPGQVVMVGGHPAVKFEVAPNYRFVLDKSVKSKKWADLAKENPPIKRIEIAELWPSK